MTGRIIMTHDRADRNMTGNNSSRNECTSIFSPYGSTLLEGRIRTSAPRALTDGAALIWAVILALIVAEILYAFRYLS